MPAIHSPTRTHVPATMKINSYNGRGGSPCPPEHSPTRTHVSVVLQILNVLHSRKRFGWSAPPCRGRAANAIVSILNAIRPSQGCAKQNCKPCLYTICKPCSCINCKPCSCTNCKPCPHTNRKPCPYTSRKPCPCTNGKPCSYTRCKGCCCANAFAPAK